MLDPDVLLQSATHRSHLARASVALAVRPTDGVGGQGTGLGALTDRLVVLHHTHGTVCACLRQTGARSVEI